MSGSEHSVETKSSNNHPDLFMSGSDHTVETQSSNNDPDLFMSGSDHTVETQSSNNHPDLSLSGSEHSVETKSSNNHPDLFMSGSEHSVETKSSNKHPDLFMSGSDHTVETKSSNNHPDRFMSGSDHTVETKSSNNHPDLFMSGSDHTVETQSSNNHPDLFMSGSDHTVETQSSNNHPDLFMSGSEHSVETQSSYNHPDLFMSGSEHSVETQSSNNHLDLFMSGSEHSVETQSSNNHPDLFMSGSDHTFETKTSNNHPDLFMSGSDHTVETESSSNYPGVFMPGVDHSVETKPIINHSGVVMSGSGHSVETRSSNNHSGIFISGNDHRGETKPCTNRSGIFISGSNYSLETKSSNYHSGVSMSGSDHSVETKSSSNNSGVFMSACNHTFETMGTVKLSGVFMSGSNHSVETKSSTNHSGAFMSESDHTVETKSSSNHSDVFMSGSDQSFETRSSSNHSGVFMFRSDHTVETKPCSNHSGIFMSGSDHSVEIKPYSNHSGVFMSGSDHSVKTTPTINPSAVVMSGSDHSVETSSNHSGVGMSSSNHYGLSMSGSDHSVETECSSYSSVFMSESNHSVETKLSSSHSRVSISGSDCTVETKSSSNNFGVFMTGSDFSVETKSSSNHSDVFMSESDITDFHSGNSHFSSVNIDLNKCSLKSKYSVKSKPNLTADLKFEDCHQSTDLYSIGDYSSHCKPRCDPMYDFHSGQEWPLETKFTFNNSTDFKSSSTHATDFEPSSFHKADFKPWRDHSVDFKCSNLSTEFEFKSTYYDTRKPNRVCTQENTIISEARYSGGQHFVPPILPLSRVMDENVLTSLLPAYHSNHKLLPKTFLSQWDEHREFQDLIQNEEDVSETDSFKPTSQGTVNGEVLSPETQREKTIKSSKSNEGAHSEECSFCHSGGEASTINPQFQGKTKLDHTVPPAIIGQVTRTINHAPRHIQNFVHGGTHCTQQCPSARVMAIFSPFAVDTTNYSAPTRTSVAAILSEDSCQRIGYSLTEDVCYSSSMCPPTNPLLSSHWGQDMDQERNTTDYSTRTQQHKTRGQKQVTSVVNTFGKSDTKVSDSHSVRTPGNTLSNDSLSLCKSTYNDEINDFDSFVSQNVEDILSLSELCANSEETHIVTFSNNGWDTVHIPEKLKVNRGVNETFDTTGCVSTYSDSSLTACSVEDVHQTFSSYSLNSFLSLDLIKNDATRQDSGDMAKYETNQDIAKHAADDVYKMPGSNQDATADCTNVTSECSHDFTVDDIFYSTSNTYQDYTDIVQRDVKQTTLGLVRPFSSAVRDTDETHFKTSMKSLSHRRKLESSSHSLLDILQNFSQNTKGAKNKQQTTTVCIPQSSLNGEKMIHELNRDLNSTLDIPEIFPEVSHSSGFDSSLRPPVITCVNAITIAHKLAKTAIQFAINELWVEIMDDSCRNSGPRPQSVVTSHSAQAEVNTKPNANNEDIHIPRVKRSTWMENVMSIFEAQSVFELFTDNKNTRENDTEKRMLETNEQQRTKDGDHDLNPKESHADLSKFESSYQGSTQPFTSKMNNCTFVLPLKNNQVEGEEEQLWIQNITGTDNNLQPRHRLIPNVGHRTVTVGNVLEQTSSGSEERTANSLKSKVLSKTLSLTAKSQVNHRITGKKDRQAHAEDSKPQFPQEHSRIFAFRTSEHVELYEMKSQSCFSTYERLMPPVDDLGVICGGDSSKSHKDKSESKHSFLKRKRDCKVDTDNLLGHGQMSPYSTDANTSSSIQYGIYVWSPIKCLSDSSSDGKCREFIPTEEPKCSHFDSWTKERTNINTKNESSNTPTENPRGKHKFRKPSRKSSLFKKTSKLNKHAILLSRNSVIGVRQDGVQECTALNYEHTSLPGPAVYTSRMMSTGRRMDRETESVNVSYSSTQDRKMHLLPIISDNNQYISTSTLSGIPENTNVMEEQSIQIGLQKGSHLIKSISGVCDVDMVGCKQDICDTLTQYAGDKLDVVQSDLSGCIVPHEGMVYRTSSAPKVSRLLSDDDLEKTDLDKSRTDLVIDMLPVQKSVFPNASKTQSLKCRITQGASIVAQKVINNAYEQLQGELLSKGLNEKFPEQIEALHKLDLHDRNVSNKCNFQGFVKESESRKTESSLSVSTDDDNTDLSISSLPQQVPGNDHCDFPKCKINETDINKDLEYIHISVDHTSQNSDHRSPIRNIPQTSPDQGLNSIVTCSNGTDDDQLRSSNPNFRVSVKQVEETCGYAHELHTWMPKKQCVSSAIKGDCSSKKPVCPFELVREAETERYRLLTEPQEYLPFGPGTPILQNLDDTCIKATSKLEDEQWYFDNLYASNAQHACQYYSRRIQCSLCKKD